MQCSTGCGNPAASDCRKEQCGRCCVGCRRHPRKLPPAGQPGSCECGQIASPNCEDLLCALCCEGCQWHGFDSTDSDESTGDYFPVSAPAYVPYGTPAQQPRCTCGQTASPLCDYLLCGGCCHGCSRHAGPDTEEEEEESQEEGPEPGQPGSCSCGQTASPICDYLLCSSCCRGCRRHNRPSQTSEEEEEPEADPYQPPAAQQRVWCGGHCGQQASPSCSVGRCRNCCSAAPSSAACCSYHSNRMLPAPREFLPSQDPRHYDYSDSDSFLDYGEPGPATQTAAQQQQQRCACGQIAAATCSVLRCASCCQDATCARHGVSRLETVSYGYGAGLMGDPIPWTFADTSLAGRVRLVQNLSSLHGSAGGAPPAAQPAALGGAQQQSAAAARQVAAGAAARGSSAAGRDTGRAAGRPDQQQGSAGAGPSSSSSGGSSSSVAKAGIMPASEAEEALFQLQHCVVCLDEPRSVLLLPCKHLVLCAGCMVQMQRHARQEYMAGDSDDGDVKCPVCCEPAPSMLPGIILS